MAFGSSCSVRKINFNVTKHKGGIKRSSADSFVLFVSFVVR